MLTLKPSPALKGRAGCCSVTVIPPGAITEEANPNGAANNIAGITDEGGRVLGMMPHPERSCEELLGSADGNLIFQSIADSCLQA